MTQERSRAITDALLQHTAARAEHKQIDSWGAAYAARTTKEEREKCKKVFWAWEQQAKKEKAAWLRKREEKARLRKRSGKTGH